MHTTGSWYAERGEREKEKGERGKGKGRIDERD
jgi:hypothetical protein